MADLLVTDGVTKRYGGLVANDTVTMTLQPGEVRGLIGPNGAGKTTFVNLLTDPNIFQPTASQTALINYLSSFPPHAPSAALLLARFMQTLLFGVTATDTATFAAVVILLIATGTAAAYLPTRRATRLDPVQALRAE